MAAGGFPVPRAGSCAFWVCTAACVPGPRAGAGLRRGAPGRHTPPPLPHQPQAVQTACGQGDPSRRADGGDPGHQRVTEGQAPTRDFRGLPCSIAPWIFHCGRGQAPLISCPNRQLKNQIIIASTTRQLHFPRPNPGGQAPGGLACQRWRPRRRCVSSQPCCETCLQKVPFLTGRQHQKKAGGAAQNAVHPAPKAAGSSAAAAGASPSACAAGTAVSPSTES